MTSTVFVDNTTVVYASWLNDVNTATYTTVPALQTSVTANTSAIATINANDWVTTNRILNSNVTDAKIASVAWSKVTSTPTTVSGYGITDVGKRLYQIQVYTTGAVATGTTILPIDDTIPQKTEGDQFMSVSITPSNASSTLEIDVSCLLSSTVTNANLIVALFQDALPDALAVSDTLQPIATTMTTVPLKFYMTAGTTSPITFKVRAGMASGTITFNGGSGSRFFGGKIASFISVKEWLP